MGKTVTTTAVAIILLNLCPPSYGKDAVVASLHSNNDERRSLRKGLAVATNEKSNDIEEEATHQSVKFHTKLSEAAATSTIKKNRVAEALNNKFFDMSGLTEKERNEMMEMAQSLKASEDSIDWDAHRDEYVQVLKQSMSRRSQSSSDKEAATAAATTSKGRALQTEEVDVVVVVEEEDDNFDGDVFDQYEYSKGNCPNAGSQGVPCAPDNLPLLCNKYNREEGSFRACLDACKDAFCCVHNAPAENWLAPNCNTDENCSQYNWCYIAWWKLRDTIGPALLLRPEQNDDFFDIKNEEISEDVTNDPFWQPFFMSPFGDIDKVIEDGTEEVVGEDGTPVMEFNAERIFLDPPYWDYEPEY